jgi:hypothetical protein
LSAHNTASVNPACAHAPVGSEGRQPRCAARDEGVGCHSGTAGQGEIHGVHHPVELAVRIRGAPSASMRVLALIVSLNGCAIAKERPSGATLMS